MIKNKKAGMSISIVFLVIATIALCVTALFIFSIRAPKPETAAISELDSMNSFYAQELVFDFFIWQIADNVAKKNPSVSAEDFPAHFMVTYLNTAEPSTLPAEFKSKQTLDQIKDPSKYKVSKTLKELSFTLENFELSNSYTSKEKGAITKLRSVRNISSIVQLS